MKQMLGALLALLGCFAAPAWADPNGSATGGTMGTQSALAGCLVNVAVTSGQQTGLRCGPDGGLLIESGGGDSPTTTIPDASISTGYQQLTSLATAMSFTPPATTTYCLVTAEAASLRFRADGVAPTASVGQPLLVGQPATFRMSIANLTALQFIQQSSGGILNVSCFKDS